MSEEIKACPFCGSGARVQKNGTAKASYWEVVCDSCDFCGPAGETKEQAIAAWNRRTPSPDAIRREAIEGETIAVPRRLIEKLMENADMHPMGHWATMQLLGKDFLDLRDLLAAPAREG